MTNATLKALIDVYAILVKAGWGDLDDEGAERSTADGPTEEEAREVEPLYAHSGGPATG